MSICPRIIEFPTVSENIKHEYLVTNANSSQIAEVMGSNPVQA